MPSPRDPNVTVVASSSAYLDPSLEQFESCKQIALAAGDKPPFEVFVGTNFGRRRVKAKDILCIALTEMRPDVGTRILDVDNYYDCRIENPVDILDTINAAIRAAGGRDDAGFLDGLLAEIDDMKEADKQSLGIINQLIDKIQSGNFPRQGTNDRAFLEGAVILGSDAVKQLIDIIGKTFPGAGKYKDNIYALMGILIDTLFFIGDFIAEVGAARKELGVRLISKRRWDLMRTAYAKMYGAEPSTTTVAAWCRYGKQPNVDAFTAPDGTTGRYDAALATWRTKQQLVNDMWSEMRSVFGENGFGQFIATNVIYAGILGAYAPDDAEDILFGNWENSVTSAAKFSRSTLSMVYSEPGPGGPTTTPCGLPQSPANDLTTWMAATALYLKVDATFCKTDAFMPFWEDKKLGNWGWSPPKITTDWPRRMVDVLNLKRGILAAMNLNYYRVEQQGKNQRIVGRWQRGDLADRILAVNKLWQRWADTTFPNKGKKTRRRLIRETTTTLWSKWMGVINSAQASTNWNYLYPFQTTGVPNDRIWRDALTFVMTGEGKMPEAPNQSDPKYAGIKARCPDQTTSCLPCDIIKTRRPIGAKPIDIPMLVNYTLPLTSGSAFTDANAEIKAKLRAIADWKKPLQDAGYPGYYIDCIAQDLVFTSPTKRVGTGVVATGVTTGAFKFKTPPPAGAPKSSDKKPLSGLSSVDMGVYAMNDQLRGTKRMGNKKTTQVNPIMPVPAGLSLNGIPDSAPMKTGTVVAIVAVLALGAVAYNRWR